MEYAIKHFGEVEGHPNVSNAPGQPHGWSCARIPPGFSYPWVGIECSSPAGALAPSKIIDLRYPKHKP
jgi:hypothetical protein